MFTGLFSTISKTSLVVIQNRDPNSMAPTYFQGDLFVINKADPQDIDLGDVIVYQGPTERIIHRVVDIEVIDGEYFYRTKGDNPNNFLDVYGIGFLIPYDVILGKIVSRIPYLGHLSLALQNDPATQIFTFLIVGIIVIAIIFWPEEEEEEDEEDEYIEISKQNMKLTLFGWGHSGKLLFSSLSKGKSRIFGFLLVCSLLLLIIAPLVYPFFISQDTSQEYGIRNAYVKEDNRLTNGFQEVNYFIQLPIEFFDYSPGWNRIDHIDVLGYKISGDNQTLITETTWKSLRTMKGQFTYGGCVFIKGVQLTNGTNDLLFEISMFMNLGLWGSDEVQFSLTYPLEVTF